MGTTAAEIVLLRRALEALGWSQARFAEEILAVEPRTLRYWLAGQRPVAGSAVQLCRLVLDDPASVRRVLAVHG